MLVSGHWGQGGEKGMNTQVFKYLGGSKDFLSLKLTVLESLGIV